MEYTEYAHSGLRASSRLPSLHALFRKRPTPGEIRTPTFCVFVRWAFIHYWYKAVGKAGGRRSANHYDEHTQKTLCRACSGRGKEVGGRSKPCEPPEITALRDGIESQSIYFVPLLMGGRIHHFEHSASETGSHPLDRILRQRHSGLICPVDKPI